MTVLKSPIVSRLQPGNPAPEAFVLNIDGQTVPVSHAWQNGPVLLTFLRHFG